MNKAILFGSLAIASVIFSGCGATGSAFTEFSTPKPDKALIYVYRPSAFKGSMIVYDVHDTTKDNPDLVLGTLENGGYMEIEATEGTHELWGKTEVKRGVNLDLQKGKIYCVKGEVSFGLLVGRPDLSVVDLNTCKTELAETKKIIAQSK